MKFIKNCLIATALLIGISASAQRGFDLFGPVRDIVAVPMTSTISTATTVTAGLTNGPIFVRYFEGIGVADVNDYTNAGSNTFVMTPATSTDNTNWTILTNYAFVNTTALVYSNYYYAPGTNASLTNLLATNNTLLPGTVTTPTASTAGWATAYIAPAAFTNGGAITNGAGTNTYAIAWSVRDAGPYVRFGIASTGTNIFNVTFRAALGQQ